jgi:glycosyltransferase involved in cell wall biosynthesis
MTTARFYLIEFGCSDHKGHRTNSLAAIAAALARTGYDVACGINQAAERSIVHSLKAAPVFRLTPWPPVSRDPICGEIETFILHGEVGAEDMSVFLNAAEKSDVILINTASENEIWALANWLGTRDQRDRPYVVLNVFLPTFFDCRTEDPNLRGRLLRTAIRRLNSFVSPERRLYVTLTENLARVLESIAGVNFLVVPNPIDLEPFSQCANPTPGEPIRIAAPGQPKGTKGAAIISSIAARTNHPDAVFVVQNWPDNTLPPPNVETLPSGLPRDQYVAYINSCHLTVLPYDAEFYAFGVSAVFEEAVAAGHGILTSTGTWMSELIDTKNAVGGHVPAGDYVGFARSLDEMIGKISGFRREALRLAARWKEGRGTPAYLSMILDALNCR